MYIHNVQESHCKYKDRNYGFIDTEQLSQFLINKQTMIIKATSSQNLRKTYIHHSFCSKQRQTIYLLTKWIG